MGTLGFYVAVFGNLHGLFGSQELWLEHCVWLQYIFDFAMLLSGTDDYGDGQRPRKEEMGRAEAVIAKMTLAPFVVGSLERVWHVKACEAV